MTFLRYSIALAFAFFAALAPRALAGDSASAAATTSGLSAIAASDTSTDLLFVSQPTGPASTITAGGTLNLTGAVVTSPSPVTYQWLLNGRAIPGATSIDFSKNPVSLADAGLYALIATNADGAFSSTLIHVVIAPQPGRIFPGQATTGRPTFSSGAVNAVLPLPDGGALIGGAFTANPSANVPKNGLIRIRADGSTHPDLPFSLEGIVRSLLSQPDGKILISGDVTPVGGATRRFLYRLNADLTPDVTFNSAVASETAPGATGALALDSTGRIYFGFHLFSSAVVRRFSPSGVLDEDYSLSLTDGSNFVRLITLAVQSDDKLLIAGNFSHIARAGQPAQPKNRIARANPDGSIDSGFTASLDSFAQLNDLKVTSLGRIFVTANFSPNGNLFEVSALDGATVPRLSFLTLNKIVEGADGRLVTSRTSGSSGISRLNIPVGASATIDTTFSVGTGPNSAATALAPTADGSLWVAGQFTTFDGFASGGVIKLHSSVKNVAIFNHPIARTDAAPGATVTLSVGAVGTDPDYQWFKNGAPLSDDVRINGSTTAVLAISGVLPSDDDTYTVAVTGGPSSVSVTSTAAKLNVLGAPKVFGSPAALALPRNSTAILSADVIAAAPSTYVWKRGETLIVNGGRYSGATTATLIITDANSSDNGAYTLTVTNTLGTASTSPATVTVEAANTARDPSTAVLSAPSGVHNILHLPDGRTLLAASSVTGSDSFSASDGLAVINPDRTVSTVLGGVLAGSVQKLVRQPDGKILVLASRYFESEYFGKPILVRLHADLTPDVAFAPPVHPGPDTLNQLALDNQGRVYLGGSFHDYAGHESLDHLVRFDGTTGALDTSFVAANSGIAHSVHVLVNDSSGRILVGGGFSTNNYDAPTGPVHPVVRLTASGELDTSFHSEPADASLTEYVVAALAVDASHRIYVSTWFAGPSGVGLSVVRLLSSGVHDDSFLFNDSVLDQAPTTLLIGSDGKILVGGPFSTPPPGHLFRLEADGAIDTSFALGGINGSSVAALATDAGGRLWVGGNFNEFQGASADGIVVLQGEPPSFAITRHPANLGRDLGSSATFTVAVASNNGPSFEWRKNGAPLSDDDRINGATTASLTITDLVASDSGAYSVRVSIPGAETFSGPAQLSVLASPVITKSPADATIDLQGSVTFVGAATGAAPLSYQWLLEGAPIVDGAAEGAIITGATTPLLSIRGTRFAQAGAYRLRVTNTLGTATSDLARLTIKNQPGKLAAGIPKLSFDASVNAILRLQDESLLVGGDFSSVTVNGVAFPRARLVRFLPDGALDLDITLGVNGSVRALAQDSGGRVFISGDFTRVTVGESTISRKRVARLTPALTLDSTFGTSLDGPNAPINVLVPTGDGGVYIGGGSTFSGVGFAAAKSIARLDASGALDAGFAPFISFSSVASVLVRPDGSLYAGGDFGVQLLSSNGTRDLTFMPGLSEASALQLLPDGRLLVGAPNGYLRPLNARTGATTAADFSAGHSSAVGALALQSDGKILSGSSGILKRTHPLTGADDTGFLSVDDRISSIAVDASGRIWVGGTFTEYGGTPASRIVVLAGGEPESRNTPPTAQTITFTAIPNRVLSANSAANTVPLIATASSGLTPVTFSVTNSTPAGIATITGNKLVITGAGTITVQANQAGGTAGDIRYAPAAPFPQTFEVTIDPPTQTQTITFPPPAALTYGDAPIVLVATTSSDLPVAFQLVSTVPATGVATLEDGTLTILGAGKVTVKAIQPGAFPFKPAIAVTRTITINKAPLAVSFEPVSRLVRKPNPVFVPHYAGFVNGDTDAAITTAPIGKTTASRSSPEGQYPITFTGGVSTNYRFVPGAPAFLTVEGFGGAYEALLVDDLGAPRGKLEISVPTNALTYTGTLNLAPEPAVIAIRGNLSASDGESATASWTRVANPAKGISALSLGFELAGNVLDGELSIDDVPALSIASGSRLFVQALAGKTKLPAPWTGMHTLVIRDPVAIDETDTRALPLGASHASVSVAVTGIMTLKGKLADGSLLTTSAKAAHLAPDDEARVGHYRLFARPYAKRLDSFVAGELSLIAHPNQTTFSGRYYIPEGTSTLDWAKAGSSADKSYRAGFEAELVAILDPWLAPATKITTLNAVTIPAGTLVQRLGLGDTPASTATVDVAFTLPEGFDFGARDAFLPTSLNLSAKGAFTVPAPLPLAANNPAFTLTVTPATGAFTGSFTLSDIPEGKTKAVARKVTVSGTLRQGPTTADSDTFGHAHFLLDPSVNDSSTEQISGELILAPTGSFD